MTVQVYLQPLVFFRIWAASIQIVIENKLTSPSTPGVRKPQQKENLVLYKDISTFTWLV